MFHELTQAWQRQGKADISPQWREVKFDKQPFSKATESLLIRSFSLRIIH